MPASSTKSERAIFRQICELIPPHLVPKLARKHAVKSRGFTPWSHVVSMLYAQFAHSIGLNDVCDALQANRSAMASIRAAVPPSRNGLSNANKNRDSEMAQELFWTVMNQLGRASMGMQKLPKNFKRTVHAIDSTTIRLFANCMDWAKHRRRKAAAKLHLRLNLQDMLPSFVVVDSAKSHDNAKAYELCAGIEAGEIAVFDMAYIDYKHLYRLHQRGVFWVTRVRSDMKLRCVKCRIKKPKGNILRDDIVLIWNKDKRKLFPQRMRRVIALVKVDGKLAEMEFLTNNLEWAASSICDLYKSRWQIELFFKQIKQTLQLGAFLGYSRNAIEWQVWTALLMYVLLRFLHARSKWKHSFIRLSTSLRAVLWQHRCLLGYLESYGTAGGPPRMQWAARQAYLPGFG